MWLRETAVEFLSMGARLSQTDSRLPPPHTTLDVVSHTARKNEAMKEIVKQRSTCHSSSGMADC